MNSVTRTRAVSSNHHSGTMTTHHERRYPVVLITGMPSPSSTPLYHPSLIARVGRDSSDMIGTPGTGKSLHSVLLSQSLQTSVTPLVHLNIGDIVKEKGFHEGWDEEWQSWTVDEDRLLDYLEEVINPEAGPAETGE